jgi:hypothetical protein
MSEMARHWHFNCLCDLVQGDVPLQETLRDWCCPACGIALSERDESAVSVNNSGIEDVSHVFHIYVRVGMTQRRSR